MDETRGRNENRLRWLERLGDAFSSSSRYDIEGVWDFSLSSPYLHELVLNAAEGRTDGGKAANSRPRQSRRELPLLLNDQDKIDPEELGSNPTNNDSFEDVMRRRFSRRGLMRGAMAAVPLMVLGTSLVACSDDEEEASGGGSAQSTKLAFTPITPNTDDKVTVPTGYEQQVLIKWGDPVLPGATALASDNASLSGQTATQQAQRFGYNADFLAYFPLKDYKAKSPSSGLLSVNHEYTNEDLMFPGYDAKAATKAQVDVAIAAHGLSIVEISRDKAGKWSYKPGAALNRRVTGETEMTITGPAAGNDKMKVASDATGTKVRGMLNNCGGGKTPWGTLLTCEENFNQYFANLNNMPDSDPRKAIHRRYGLTPAASERGWERYYDRFDLAKEPNESFRFGWVVEMDPYDPKSTPKKRTALGRFKHEAATSALAKDGRVVIYSGDDERFDYFYKFVTADKFDDKKRENNLDLLDKGTLFVAKLNDDGSGQWLPMISGQGPLTAAAGFANQGDVLINTRGAADLLGATKMDRPEDIETSPITGKVYAAFTNNTNRTAEQVNKSNPRANNKHGHVMEITEAGSDNGASTFRWEILIRAGDPKVEADDTYFGGFDKTKVSPISCPDNVCLDSSGNLWIATDGAPGQIKWHDSIHAVPVEGPERGYVRAFLSGPVGCETAALEFNQDNTTLFVSIQHPGEGSKLESPSSKWPDGGLPRPGVVAAFKTGGGAIGS